MKLSQQRLEKKVLIKKTEGTHRRGRGGGHGCPQDGCGYK
jgi:hypothetical protein